MKKAQTGFTIIEMLVAISIMAAITTTLFVAYPKFGRRLAIEREAQFVALSLRDAEERAIRTQRAGGAFTAPFGVHFDLNARRSYILFADINSNGYFDAGVDLAVETFSIGNSVRLDKLCAGEKNASGDCTFSSLSITFKRPAPLIEVKGNGGGGVLPNTDFEIYVKTDDGVYAQLVVIWTTGAVSIEDVPVL